MSAPLVHVPLPFAEALARDAELPELVDHANELANEAQSAGTRRAYLSSFTAFAVWCREKGVASLPAESATLAVYLGLLEKRGRLVPTIDRALAAITDAHLRHGVEAPHPSPVTCKVMKGLRRRIGVAPRNQKSPISDEDLAAMLRVLGDDLAGRRDRVLLTWGWTGAFRRGELVAVRMENLQRTRTGILVTVTKSKADQEAKGERKVIPAYGHELCPVRAFDDWIAISGITHGAVFRGLLNGKIRPHALRGRAVAEIVKRVGQQAGLDPKLLAGHSLRAGFVTTAYEKGCTLDSIMKQTNQKSERTTRRYVRHAEAFTKNAAVGLL